ncbi:MAG: hypothetical protein RLZZ165_2061 [Bacteroidota bacterium]
MICAIAVWIFLGGLCGTSFSQQPYFNEWMVPGNPYVKLKVAEDGLYRVNRSDLPTLSPHAMQELNSLTLQVFYRGVEVPVYVHGSPGGGFDYLEFIGRRNDGGIDSLLYRSNTAPFGHDPSQQPNPFTSFFTDTSAYFITWGAAGTRRLHPWEPKHFAGHDPAHHYRYRVVQEYRETYSTGGGTSSDVQNVLNPDWITGEGFQGIPFHPGSGPGATEKYFSTPGFANSGSPSHIQARVVGVNNANPHILAIAVDGAERFRDTTIGINISTMGFDHDLPLNPLTTIRFHAHGQSNPVDQQSVTWCTIEYDRNFDLNKGTETILRNWNHPDTTYLRFYHADFDTSAWVIDPADGHRIKGMVAGDTLKFLVPGSPRSRDLYFFTDKAIKSPAIEPKLLFARISADTAGASFVIITHPKFQNSAEQYAAYRSSDTANRLITKVVYIDDIYNEFGYGSMTSWAIKNFCRYALKEWQLAPKHFMIWGKGRNCPRLDNQENYIPVFGTPANDLEYVTNLDYNVVDLVPKAGMGRVSIKEDRQGLDYLDKVREYEHQRNEPWIKNALFMGGGANQQQADAISFFLTNKQDGFNLHWEREPLVGKVWSFQKRNGEMVSNDFLSTEERINRGVGLMQYFGHSAVNLFELDLLEPSRYENVGMYPLMLAFGCSGGNYNELVSSYGERFILEPRKGGIGYIGNTTSGFIDQLGQYGRAFYPAAFQTMYGKSMGEVMAETIRQFCMKTLASENIFGANHAKQMNYQGDPSIRLHLPLQCDLRVGPEDIFFPGVSPSILDPQFTMNVILHNDGRSFEDSFDISVVHRLPNNLAVWSDTIRHAPIMVSDTVEVTVINPGGMLLAGYNQFEVHIDPLGRLPESHEDNNHAEIRQIFAGNSAMPILPPEFSIVGEPTITLTSSTYQMRPTETVHYSFEIDTVPTFDSPFKKASPVVAGTSSFGEWTIPFAMTPGEVYYWRSKLSDTYPEQWAGSSLKYVPGQNGWSQGTVAQLLRSDGDGVALLPTAHRWEFQLRDAQLHAYIQSLGYPGRAAYFLGSYGSGGEAGNGVLYTPIHRKTLEPWIQSTHYGDWAFAPSPSPSSWESITPVLTAISSMAQGDYFLMVSSLDPMMEYWPDEVLKAFEQLGGNFSTLRAMRNGDRLIFFGMKGGTSGSAVLIDHPNLETIGQPPMHDLTKSISHPSGKGAIASTVIGPTDSWATLNFAWSSMDIGGGDSSWVSVHGIRRDGSDSLLLDRIASPVKSLAAIDAGAFPKIRLTNRVKDLENYTAPQLQRWEVYHSPVPDLAFDADTGLVIPGTLTEGQILHLRFMVRNLTLHRADSVLVKYSLQASDRTVIPLGSQRYGTMEAREVRQFSHALPTIGLPLQEGTWTLMVEVNPDEDQPEIHRFNNLYYHPLSVRTDKVMPLVDVTVDGKHLMGGDIVSSEPEIVIQVNDDNPYLPVPVSDSTYRIWFGRNRTYQDNHLLTIENNDSIEKVPVRMPQNRSQLIFRPGHLEDGEYTLAVQGFDAKGNAAGKKPYTIQMNVVNQKTLSEVLPYPNPFSTACHFAYVLTGDERPSRFDIEIYTITGKMVKVIDLHALGEVYFGNNITQYAWDGRDEFGDLLANGVYLYRVRAEFSGSSQVMKGDDRLSSFFNNGMGKMYILR